MDATRGRAGGMRDGLECGTISLGWQDLPRLAKRPRVARSGRYARGVARIGYGKTWRMGGDIAGVAGGAQPGIAPAWHGMGWQGMTRNAMGQGGAV